jgi:hypothetical protein
MPKNEHTDSTNIKLSEVKIKYIGPTVLEALEKAGITTVADLAGSAVDEIESILKSKVPAPVRTPEKIAGMIQEATTMVADRQKDVAKINSASAENQSATVPEFTAFFNYGYIDDGLKRWRAVIHPHDDGEKPEPPEWHLNPDDEGYTVRFEHRADEEGQERWQTIVYNGKSLEETDITGWTPDKWWPWIAEKASLNGEEDLETTPVSNGDTPVEVRESPEEKALKIARFDIHLPSDKRANTLVADVAFEISEDLLAQQPLHIQVEVLYVNLEHNASHLAGYDSKPLKPGQRAYESQVEFPMPELGRYRPHCVVLSLPSGEHGDYQEDGIFNVIPKKQVA